MPPFDDDPNDPDNPDSPIWNGKYRLSTNSFAYFALGLMALGGVIGALKAVGGIASEVVTVPYNYVQQNLLHPNGKPLSELRPHLQARAGELTNQLLTQRLIQYGFQCANLNCTARGFKITAVDLNRLNTRTDAWLDNMPSDYRHDIITSRYTLASVNDPAQTIDFSISVRLAHTTNVSSMSYGIYEYVTGTYTSPFLDNLATRSRTWDRANPRTRGPDPDLQGNELRGLIVGMNAMNIPASNLCTRTSQTFSDRYYAEPFASTRYDGVRNSWTISQGSAQFQATNCWNATTVSEANGQTYQLRDVHAIRPATINGRPLTTTRRMFPMSLLSDPAPSNP